MAIDRDKIIKEMSQMKVQGDETGIIDGFGVYITQISTDFWQGFADKLLANVDPDLKEATEYLLVNAAKVCGYVTGYGIITCDEWKTVIGPMVENVEDVLHGAFAIFTAWGWANAEIIELIPGEKMVLRAYNYYEADVAKYGTTEPKAYMVQGIAAAFFALAYAGEYDADSDKYDAFKCEQTKGIECGDEYGEFVVTPNTDR